MNLKHRITKLEQSRKKGEQRVFILYVSQDRDYARISGHGIIIEGTKEEIREFQNKNPHDLFVQLLIPRPDHE